MVLKYKDILELVRNNILDISVRGITKIERLPDNLEELYCFNNKLKELPKLPERLKALHCSCNEFNVEGLSIKEINNYFLLKRRKRRLYGINI